MREARGDIGKIWREIWEEELTAVGRCRGGNEDRTLIACGGPKTEH